MTSEVTFLHVADLHLGAPMRGLRDASLEWAARLQTAIAEAYARAIDAALSNEVDFVILAGDAFDTARPSYGDYLRFFEGLERLDEAGIPTYLIMGNHDPFTSWSSDIGRLPASVKLLGVNGPEFALFSRNGKPLCLIGGRSYYNQSWAEGEKVAGGISRSAAVEALAQLNGQPNRQLSAQAVMNPADAPFCIGVIHTGLDIDASKAATDLDELLAADVDYWACGHLHRACAFPNQANPRVVFPGCVQGRDIKETDERGCYLVKLTASSAAACDAPPETHSNTHPNVELTFVPTSSVVFQKLNVDVSACQTLADVARFVQAQLFHANGEVHCDEMIVRVTLTGETALHGFLRRRDIIDDLRKHINNAFPSFFCDALEDRTRSAAGELESSPFSRVVVDMANEQRGREDVMINYIQNEFVKRGIAVSSALSRQVGVFNDAAEALVFDLLSEQDDEGGEGEVLEA